MIRAATLNDIPRIISIGQEVIDASTTISAVVDYQKATQAIRRALNDKKMAVFVSEIADQVVGFFVAIEDEYWFAKKKYGTDLAFCVLPQHADQGVWLLRRFIRWTKSRGIEHIILGLSTGLDEQGRTGALYQAHGLKHVGGMYSTTKEGTQ